MKRWWLWAVAALAAIVGLLGRSGNPWKKRATQTLDRAEQAGHDAIHERAATAEKAADDELAAKRAADDDDRLRDALARARAERARRDAGKPGGS